MAYVIGTVHLDTLKASLNDESRRGTPDDQAAMMRAALIGHTRAVLMLLDRGVCVNCRDISGRSPLMEAVFGGHLETVAELLRLGANVDSQANDGWTALMEAAAKGRLDLVEILLAHGADAHIKNNKGRTALLITAKCNTDVARMLRESGSRNPENTRLL